MLSISSQTSSSAGDIDEDGFGDDNSMVSTCARPEGYVEIGGDCDDVESFAHPMMIEFCDGIDNDCNGTIDESGSIGESVFYADSDGDGFGDPNSTTQACNQPSGYTSDSTDCDDGESNTNPNSDEYCDGIDNNCDGAIDENTAVDAPLWYADDDNDGYGDVGNTMNACSQPLDYTTDSSDCDDNDDDINPGAVEICNGEDDNCDGSTDDNSSIDATAWYADDDVDGFGDLGTLLMACDQPNGYITDNQDCDDNEPTINPNADEYCDEIDNNCDGEVDEDSSVDTTTWYEDIDGDGFGGDYTGIQACDQPQGFSSENTDCDDVDPTVNDLCPASTCVDLQTSDPTTQSGNYLIDPDGSGGFDPFYVYCDMDTDGGGWTRITGALINEQDWMVFEWIDGPEPNGPHTMGWMPDNESFYLDPLNSYGSCDTTALRATATLPFGFNEWYGEWTGGGFDTNTSQHDDMHSSFGWGVVTDDCYGHLLFGTDMDTSKQGGDWGLHWNGVMCDGCSSYVNIWSWGQETVSTTNVLRWENADQGADEEVVIYNIDIWVR